MLRLITAVIFVALISFPVPAAYIPDNNGRSLYTPEAPKLRHVAKHRRHHAGHRKIKATRTSRKDKSPPWNMVRVKTVQGFYITVHPAYAHKFLKLFVLLQEKGYKIDPSIVGCYARGGHVGGSNHYIGAACDIQEGWNRGPSFVYHMGPLIKQAGLYDGCSFGDCGHIEAVRGTHNRPPPLIAALEKFKTLQSTANYQP